MKSSKSTANRIRAFTSLDDHEAANADGQIIVREHGGHRIRSISHNGEWWYSIIDVIACFDDVTDNAQRYWSDLKRRLDDEGASEVYAKIVKLKLPGADGKLYPTDCASSEMLLRIVQSIPSKKLEPLKQMLAESGHQMLQAQAQAKAIDGKVKGYEKAGREREWVLVA